MAKERTEAEKLVLKNKAKRWHRLRWGIWATPVDYLYYAAKMAVYKGNVAEASEDEIDGIDAIFC